MAMEFWWWPVTSPWLSPGAAWFVFFNLLVGAIAVMSSRGQTGGPAPATRRRLARTASTLVMESLRSISIFASHSGASANSSVLSPLAPSHLHHVQDQYCSFQEQEAQEMSTVAPPGLREHEPAPPSGASGATATTVPPSGPVAAAAAAAADVAPVPASQSEKEDGDQSITMDQAYALARSRGQSPAAAAAADTTAREPVKVSHILKRRGHACGRGAEEVEGKAEVNARAEQFIRQFRQELKLERLNSILNYSGAVTGSARGSSDRLV